MVIDESKFLRGNINSLIHMYNPKDSNNRIAPELSGQLGVNMSSGINGSNDHVGELYDLFPRTCDVAGFLMDGTSRRPVLDGEFMLEVAVQVATGLRSAVVKPRWTTNTGKAGYDTPEGLDELFESHSAVYDDRSFESTSQLRVHPALRNRWSETHVHDGARLRDRRYQPRSL